jgi:PAS domain S-box-containing protein
MRMGDEQCEEFYRALIDYGNNYVAVVNPDGTFRYVSPSNDRLTGLTPEETKGRNSFELIHPDDAPALLEVFSELLQQPGASRRTECRIRGKSGDWPYIQIEGTNLLDHPIVRGIVINIRDINEYIRTEEDLRVHQVELEAQNIELRQAQEELERSRDRYADLYDFAPVGYAGFDEAGVIREINLTAAATLGSERGKLIGKPFITFVAGAYRSRFFDHLEKSRLRRERATSELRLELKGGQAIDVELTTISCVDSEGASVLYRTSIFDITERKRVDETLRESQERLDVAQETAGIGFWNLELTDMKLTWTKGLKSVFELDPDGPTPTFEEFWDFVHPDSKEYVDEQAAKQFKPVDGPISYTYMIVTKKGNVKYLYHKGQQALDDQGQLVRIYGSIQDVTERKAAEEALARSEERYRLLLEHAGMGIAYWDLEGRLLLFNRKALEQMGGRLEDYLGKTYHELYGSDFGQVVAERFKAVQLTGESREYEDMVDLPTGRKWFISSYTKVVDAYGETTGTQVISTEITGRKQTEELLRKASDEWRETFDAADEMIMLLDADFTIVKANRATAEFLGAPVEEITGKPCYLLMHKAEEPLVDCPMARMMLSGGHEEKEIFIPERDIWAFVTVDPIFNEDGSIAKIVHVVEDITERKRTMDHLEMLNQCFLSLGSDPCENVEKILQTGRDILGASILKYCCRSRSIQYRCSDSGIRSEPLGKDAGRCFLQDAGLTEELAFVPDLERIPPAERHPDIDGLGLRSLLAVPVKMEEDLFGSLCLFDRVERDFTMEERELLMMLARAIGIEEDRFHHEENLRDFIDIASHELRHPITIMKGYSLILKEQGDLIDESNRDVILSIIDHGADRLDNLIGGLLDISRIERGKFEVKRRNQSIVPLVERSVEEMGVRGFNNEFAGRIPGGLGLYRVDEEKFAELMVILLENAVKYSSAGSVIEVEVEETGEGVLVSVLDRGMGVSEEDREHVFDRFFQVEEVTHHSTPGMGMGLYIARNIVEAHGGRIWCEPREGGGSAFRFTISH